MKPTIIIIMEANQTKVTVVQVTVVRVTVVQVTVVQVKNQENLIRTTTMMKQIKQRMH